ncbi:MAG: hypothetical protein ACQET5_15790 [Halobacteriota archaeon]
MSSMFLPVVSTVVFVAVLVTLAVAIRRENGAAVVNGIVVVGVVLFPAAVGSVASVTTGPALSLWLGFAGLLHMIGMLGFYESVWWWDHLTHTVSAGLVAALCYGTLLATTTHSRIVVAAVTVGFTLVGGIFWELLELVARALGKRFDVEPALVYYGWKDTVFDIAFDLLAAIVIVLLDIERFASLAVHSPDLAGELLVASTVVLVCGSLAIAGGLTASDAWPDPE